MLGHDKLQNYYKTNFALMQHHKYSLTEIENMLPWERFIYINLLQGYLKEEEQKARDQAATLKAKKRL
jgi:hypothetical protein